MYVNYYMYIDQWKRVMTLTMQVVRIYCVKWYMVTHQVQVI